MYKYILVIAAELELLESKEELLPLFNIDQIRLFVFVMGQRMKDHLMRKLFLVGGT